MADSSASVQHKTTGAISSLMEILEGASCYKTHGMIFASSATDYRLMTYEELLCTADANSQSLRRFAKEFGTRTVLIHQDSIEDNVVVFWSVVRAGLIPVMSTPLSTDPQQRHAHLCHLKVLLRNPICVTTEALVSRIAELNVLNVITREMMVGSESLKSGPTTLTAYPTTNEAYSTDATRNDDFEDLTIAGAAVLMLTSGSTGNAKAVELSVSQIYASICGKSTNWGSEHDSIFLNWIGLDHVANLVEIHLQAMLHGAQQVHVQTTTVLADPLLFLRIIDKHRVNFAFAPNFFLSLLDKEITSSDPSDPIRSVNLSCLHSIMSGGEANTVDTAIKLTQRLQDLGANGQIIRLGYGLTESCAALAYGMLDPQYEIDERHTFASIGKPISGAQMRVMKGEIETELYTVGELEICGPVVFKSYFDNPTATREAFTQDFWFKTGDRAYVDQHGLFNLVGRSKEVLNINGIQCAPQDLESVLEKANLKNALPSFYAAFSYREENSETEGFCVAYCARETDAWTVEQIARISSSLITARPNWIIPLFQHRMDKSSLGKLSRTKLQSQFAAGAYDDIKVRSLHPPTLQHNDARMKPSTPSQKQVVETCSVMLDIPPDCISVDQTIFELGVTSVSLFRFEKLLRRRFKFDQGISIITMLSNPVIWAIADAIDSQDKKIYNPVAKIQNQGSKTPLWLVHPASGNTLAFLPLARTVHDRPLFALTARGLRQNEQMFSSIAEMADTYLIHVREAQPVGPYALTGYSLGTTIAYELAKRLETCGEQVAFLGALDSPPHIIPLIENLDWTAAAVLVTYFLELIPQTQVPQLTQQFRGLSKIDTVKACLAASTSSQRNALNLDPEQLLAITNITDNFGSMAKTYHPEGLVRKIDVFYCTPLHSVGNNRESWVNDHLSRWQEFAIEPIELHECEGDHADMLNPTYVAGFEKRLSKVLKARGI